MRKCQRSWKKFCPDYKIIEWNESNFDIHSHPFLLSSYKEKAWAFVSDYARLKIIYDNGGIYLDTDVELLKNLDELLKYNCYIGVGQSGHICNTGLGFGAVKRHHIVHKMLLQYNNLIYVKSERAKFTSPILNHRVIQSIGYQDSPVKIDDCLILPCRYLDPIIPGNSENLLCDDTLSIHHYAASWYPTITRLRRKLIGLIGVKNIDKVKRILKSGKYF